MKIQRSDRATNKGPASSFTGDVYVDTIAIDGSGLSAGIVHFTPGSRTAWHRHELGQTIHITEGVGLVQRRGGPIMEIHPSDTIFFEPNEDHWHGAAPDRFMVHTAIVRLPDSGTSTEWGELVTDIEYNQTIE